MRACAARGLRAALAMVLALTLAAAVTVATAQPALLDFTPAEQQRIARHGPWPPPTAADAGNSLSGRAAAIALGQQLFFDARLSANGQVACASCHLPGLAFADGRARSAGLAPLDRNAPSLWNAVHERWQGWDGGADSLWAQAIRPLLDTREMGSNPAHLQRVIADDRELACRFERATGRAPLARDAEATMVDAAKAMAAFTATLVSPRTPFDDFRDALGRGDHSAAARYPIEAQRGLRRFIGSGQCGLCHTGPRFSNGEFADTGLPFFKQPGVVDSGRHGGIEELRRSPYTGLSKWADAPVDTTKLRHLQPQHRNFGEFKVPSLRHVAQTAPYMHDGQIATLEGVVNHYSSLSPERLHADGDQILRPLGLSDTEKAELVAFLRTLSAPSITAWRAPALPACATP